MTIKLSVLLKYAVKVLVAVAVALAVAIYVVRTNRVLTDLDLRVNGLGLRLAQLSEPVLTPTPASASGKLKVK